MKSAISICICILLAFSIQSQSSFEPGYFINNDGTKTECLIRNKDWKNNPIDIEYKIAESSKSLLAKIEEIQEFGIVGVSKYEKHKLIIDQTNEKQNDSYQILDYDYKEVEVLLKVLIQGKATLYSYETSKYKRYFFSVDKSSPEQLVYKTFQRNNNENGTLNLKGTKLEYCRKFKIQLFKNVRCGEVKPDDVAKVKLNKKSLSNYFNMYNYCEGAPGLNFDASSKKDLFKLHPRIGIGLATLALRTQTSTNSGNDNDEILYKVGLEMEFILPYNNDSWSVTLEPAYIRAPGKDLTDPTILNSFSYSALQFPLGIKYSHKLTPNAKVYGTISTLPELSLNAKLKRSTNVVDLINTDFYVGFTYGLGIKISKWNMEIRRQPRKSITPFFAADVIYGLTHISIGYEIN